MASELFRFVVVRPSQQSTAEHREEIGLFLDPGTEGLIPNLQKARKEGDKSAMIKLAQGYTSSAKFLDSKQKVDGKLQEFSDVLSKLPTNCNQYIRQNFQRIFSLTPTRFVATAAYKQALKSVSESLVAAAIDNGVGARAKTIISDLAKILQVINLISKAAPVTKEQIDQIKFILPEGIFPLPLAETNLKEEKREKAAQRKKAIEERQKRQQALADDLTSYSSAIAEVLDIFDNSSLDDDAVPPTRKKKSGFFIPSKSMQYLSATTKNTLKKVGLDIDDIDVAKTVSVLERHASETAQQVYASGSQAGRIAKIGNSEVMVFDDDIPALAVEPLNRRIPGICPPRPITEEDLPTPIITNGKPEVRSLGFADLLIVEQELARYELGEIAHIENVLKSELRDRKHRTNTISEDSITTESEETDYKESDLSSSERFELQAEAQKVINESTSMDAGTTVSASYGFVDATANFNYATNDSRSETERTASNFARETTSKAISRLEKRSLERRFRRTVRETEEINQHTFDNKSGTDNITGIYRFVDKIYNVQIVNYGKRLMLEFIVPEPAAFLRHALTSQPVETNVVKPDEPGFCASNGRKFIPLSVQDITRESYMFWVSKYGVEDVKTPPAKFKIIGKSFSKQGDAFMKHDADDGADKDKILYHAEDGQIAIPDGFVPQKAKIRADIGMIDKSDLDDESDYQRLTVQLSNRKAHFDPKNTLEREDDDDYAEFDLMHYGTNEIPVTISSIGIMAYGITVSIICKLHPHKYDAWQLATYTSIMNAYKDQLTRYNNAIESAKIRAGFTEVRGVNPFVNRETEKTELKKGCISLLTGQRFESFDAMNRNMGENRYPEIDFDDAAEEGRIVSFFEQAFEWNNMTYIFYPYFWANKKEWMQLSQLKDNDPLFTKFLQAGSSRVNVPVRPEFETSMQNYLHNSILAFGDVPLINMIGGVPNDLHFSVTQELKGQMNNMHTVGAGRLTVTNGSTSITGLETNFTKDDENKRLVIGGRTYVIKQVDSATSIQLKGAFAGESQTGIAYSFGAKLVGEPWEVKLPTNLIKVDNNLNF